MTTRTDKRIALIADVRKHAEDNYDDENLAWDHVVEAYDDDQLDEAIGRARSLNGAIKALRPVLEALAEQRRIAALEAATSAPVESDDEDEDDEDEAPRTMSGTLNRYKPGYFGCVAYSGSKSLNNGDDVASILEGATPDQTIAIAELVLDMPRGELAARYVGLNPGQKRMNSGNRIRAAERRGDITVDDVKEAAATAGFTPGELNC